MGNCLKTQLKENVNNNMLPKIGTHIYKFKPDYGGIQFVRPVLIREGIAYEHDGITPIALNTWHDGGIVFDTNSEIVIELSYTLPNNLFYVDLNQGTFTANINDFKYLPDVSQINFAHSNISGRLEDLIEGLAIYNAWNVDVVIILNNTQCTFNREPCNVNVCIASKNGDVISLKVPGTLTLIATYTISTNTWDYNPE